MNPWVYVGVAAAVVVLAALIGLIWWLRHVRRSRRQFEAELAATSDGVSELSDRIDALAARVPDPMSAPHPQTQPQAQAQQIAVPGEVTMVATLRELGDLQAAAASTARSTAPTPVVITTLATPAADAEPHREVELLSAVVANRPVWLPAKPLRTTLIKTASFAHGLRRGFSAEVRDRISAEMHVEVRRQRRERKQAIKALRRHLRDTGVNG